MSLLKNWIATIAFSTLSLTVIERSVFASEVEDKQRKLVYFIGHLNPDTDAIMAAIGAANLYHGIPARSGKVNRESSYILQKFNLPEPELVEKAEGKNFFLVDFNLKTQALPDLKPEQVVGIIDHHSLMEATIHTPTPIEINIKPWGSTCTILTQLYQQEGRSIPKEIAGALLGGVISDTLLLKSPTTTYWDVTAVDYLAPIAGVSDVQAFAEEMFKAKSELSDLSAEQILQSDYKEFVIAGKKIGWGVAETVKPEEVYGRQTELLAAMQKAKKDSGLDLVFFSVVDPVKKESRLLLLGPAEEEVAGKAFGARTRTEGWMDTTPMVSRKKEFLPKLTAALGSHS